MTDQPQKPKLPSQAELSLRKNLGPGVANPDTRNMGAPDYRSPLQPNTYWDQPERVMRYVDAANSIPDGTPAPEWLTRNMPVLQEAATYFGQKFPGKSWWEWEQLDDSDPMKQALRNLPPPPVHAMTDDEQEQDYFTIKPYTAPVQAPEPPKEPGTPGYYEPPAGVLQDRINGYTREAWDALPPEQQFLAGILPQFQNVMLIGQGALMGAQMGGIKGALAGAGFSALFGKQMQAEQKAAAEAAAKGETIATPISDAFMKLDIPRELLERALGVLYQGYSEGLAATKEGGLAAGSDAVADVLNNLPAAWQAAHEFYNLAGAGTPTDAAGNQVFRYQGVDYTKAGRAQGEVRKVVYGTEGQMDIPMLSNDYIRQELATMRQSFINGTATPDQLYADLEGRYGLGSQAREIVSGFLLDPLNVAPDVAKGVGSAAAKAVGNVPLAKALDANKTIVGAVQEYGSSLRQLPPAEASHYGAVSRFVAGLDKTGNLKDYAKPGADVGVLRRGLNYLTGLTPKARATEVVNNAAEALKLVLGEDGVSAADAYKTAVALTNPKNTPIDGMNAADAVNLPRIFESAEAVPYMEALKGQGKLVKAIWDKYQLAQPQADLIRRMANVMGRTDLEMLDALKAATPDQADLLVRQFKSKLAELAATDPSAAAVLEGINADRNFNGATIVKWADTFKRTDGPAFNESTFKAQLIVALEEGIEKWTVDWFGIKPQHWFFRTADVMKKAQSYLLLGLNPSYLMNNAINNMVTMAWDGTLGMYTAASRQAILKDLGLHTDLGPTPSRYEAGATQADIGDPNVVSDLGKYSEGSVIREAGTKAGNLQAVSDFLDKGKKIQWASTLSQKMERWSSENSMTKAMLEYWTTHWKPGDGFEKMPTGLRNVLDQTSPGLTAKIENAIAGSKNRAQAERAIMQELGQRRITDVMTPEDRAVLANFPGLMDDIERGMKKAKTPEARRQVFADARTSVERKVQQDIVRNVRKISEETTNRVKTEGVQAVMDLGYQIAASRADMHHKHRARLDDLYESVSDKTGYERRMILENGLRAEDRLWNAHQNVEGARMLGMMKALGADDPQLVTVQRMLLDQHDMWASFYQEKGKLINEFLDTKFDSREASSAAWAELNAKVEEMYTDRLEGEAGAQRIINGVLADAGETQFPGSRDQFTQWTEAVQHQHEQIGEAVRYFRTGKGNPDPDVKALIDTVLKGEGPVDRIPDRAMKDTLWREFNEKVYGTLVRRQLDAVNGGSATILDSPPTKGYAAAIQDNIAEVPPAAAEPVKIPLMVTQNMKRQLADLGYTPADIKQMRPADAWDVLNNQRAKVVEQAAAPVETAPVEQPAEVVPEPVQEAAPAPAPEPVVEKPPTKSQERARTAVRELVHEIEPGVTADRHIVNIVNKYGGYKVDSIDQITPEMVRASFSRRSIEHHAEGGDWTEFDRRLVEARAAAMEENIGRMELAAPKEMTREAWSRDLYEDLPEQADSLIAVTDAIADHWAAENGKSRDDWYNTFLLERGGTEMGEGLAQGVKGSTRWLDNGRAVIHAFESADVSTMVHEVAHVWMEQLGEADRAIVARWLKQDGKDIDQVGGKEMFARGFERYLADGQAPTPKLAKVFANFKAWMLDIYKSLTGSDIDVKLNDEVRGMFDRWMGKEAEVVQPTKYGVLEQYINGTLGETYRDLRDRLIKDYPKVSPNRANEVAAAMVLRDYFKQVEDLDNAVRIDPTPVANLYDTLNAKLEEQSAQDYLSDISGSRSIFIDAEDLKDGRTMFGADTPRDYYDPSGMRHAPGDIETIADALYPAPVEAPKPAAFEVKQGTVGPAKGKYAAFQDGTMVDVWHDTPEAATSSAERTLSNMAEATARNTARSTEIENIFKSGMVNEDAASIVVGERPITIEKAAAHLRYLLGKTGERGALKRITDTLKQNLPGGKINSNGEKVYDPVDILRAYQRDPDVVAMQPAPEPPAPSVWDAPKPKAVEVAPVEAAPTYAPEVYDGLRAWLGNRLYVDAKGNYHLKAEGRNSGPIAPYNKQLKATFKDMEELYRAAHSLPEDELPGDMRTPPPVVEASNPQDAVINPDAPAKFKNSAEEKSYTYDVLQKAAEIVKGQREGQPDVPFDVMEKRTREAYKGNTIEIDKGKGVISVRIRGKGEKFTVELTPNGWFVSGNISGGMVGKRLGLEHKPAEVKVKFGNVTYTFINESQVNAMAKSLTGKVLPGYDDFPLPTTAKSTVLFQSEPAPAIGAPLGTVDSLHQPPIEEAALESYMRDIMPILDRAERMAGEPDVPASIPADQLPAVRAYLGRAYNQMADTKMGMMRYATARRDWSLLNYTRRHGMDNYVGAVMPYQFWYTRSIMNWAVRAVTQPNILANYYRLTRSTAAATEREGYPTRLKNKMFIPLPFLPDWMGEGVYVDPYKQIFPFVQMARPFVKRAGDMNLLARKTQSNLDRMVEEGEITEAQYEEAVSSQTGRYYDQAKAVAERDLDSDSLDPLDFAFTLSGPSLPISYALNYFNVNIPGLYSGRRDKISQLPITRGIQAVTTALGIGGDRGINIEQPFRKVLGMPEIDRYEDTGINKLIADMVAEPGSDVTVDEAMQAMIDRTGPVYDEAQRRMGKLDVWKFVGSSLSLDMFPEGEQGQRQLQVEYYNAIEAWKEGDTEAIGAFYDKYPEYAARKNAFNEPESQLKEFLKSSVWDAYNNLPDLQKRDAREQLGDVFNDAFLSSETRSYDSISTSTLAMWAKTLNGRLPNKAGDVTAIPMKYTSEEDSAAYETYMADRDRRFPGIGDLLNQFYDLPQEQQDAFEAENPTITRYNQWRTKYLGRHLNLVPYMVGKENELAGYPEEIQKAVYAYRADKEELFPTINQQWDEYMALTDKAERKAYWKAHHELQDYLDWQKIAAAENPDILPFIKLDEAIQEMLLPEEEGRIYKDDTMAETIKRFSSSLSAQLLGNIYAGKKLGEGARMELKRHYSATEYPGSFDEWLDAVRGGMMP